jgi:hypothetical protein
MSDQLARALNASQDRVDSISSAMLRDVGHEFVKTATSLAGAGPYGRSFKVDPQMTAGTSGPAVLAGSDSPMAAIIERGRRPGRRPPAQSIGKRSGGSNEAAARAADRIAARGTRGRWVVKKANAQIKSDGTLDRLARNALQAITDLGG